MSRTDRLYPIPCLQLRPMMDAARLAVQTRYMPQTSEMFSYAQTPYLEAPTAALSDIAGTLGVVIKSPAQIGKTTAIENFLAWIVEYDRANTMVILDTQKSAEKMSRNRIRPFLRTRGINNPNNAREKNPDKSNSVVNIGLGSGANLLLCSAKSPSDLRSTPCKYCAFDEVDAWPSELKGEGDPLQNAIQRMMRFRGMYLLTSTPTSADGRIMQNFLLGTQETWGVLCASCAGFMPVKYDDIDFTGSQPVYACPHCGSVWNEAEIKAMAHVYSEPQNKNPHDDRYGRVLRSFEIYGTLCHEFYTWDYLKQLEIAALQLGDASYQSFRNTRLAEVYRPKDDIEIEAPALMRCAMADYAPDCIPRDVAFIVCGMDTHDQCLYVETVGVSADCKTWYGLDYRILAGNPDESAVWDAFQGDVMDRPYTRDDGVVMRPVFCFCDSGGHRTNAVYLQSFRRKRFMPIKGYVSQSTGRVAQDPLLGKQQKLRMNAGIKGACNVQFIGVNAGKDAIASLAIVTVAGENRLRYARGCGYSLEYFRGLTSEKKIGGKWIAPRGGKTENEPLDCRVYAMAAAQYYHDRYYSRGLDGGRRGEEDEMGKKKKKSAEKVNEKVAQPVEMCKNASDGAGEIASKPAPAENIPPVPENARPQKVFPHW